MVEPLVVSPSGVDAIALGDNAAFEHDGVLVQHDGIGAGEVGRSLAFVRDPRFVGTGFFAGEAPDGLTTVYGDPIPADVFVYWRDPDDPMAQEVLVGATKSAPDGTWCITGLNYNLQYVIRARASGRDDVTVVGVQPSRADVITYEGEFTNTEDFDGVAGKILITSGLSPFTATVIQPFPSGLFPVVSGRNLIIDGTTNADEVASFDVKVTSSNGTEKIIPLQIAFGFKAPQNLASEVLELDDVFSVVLTWEVANSTQQVKVYRSETPFDMENLPEPLAVLSGAAAEYTDDDVIEYDHYYYMVMAVYEQYYFASEVIDILVKVTHFPETIGEQFGGGFYIGDITITSGQDAGTYAIIMAGIESQVVARWKTISNRTAGTSSTTNGMENTLAMQSAGLSEHPAGKYCLEYQGGGLDDWYMPAQDELYLAWMNRSALAGLAMEAQTYRSSTSKTVSSASNVSFVDGSKSDTSKLNTYRVRPVRRLKRIA